MADEQNNDLLKRISFPQVSIEFPSVNESGEFEPIQIRFALFWAMYRIHKNDGLSGYRDILHIAMFGVEQAIRPDPVPESLIKKVLFNIDRIILAGEAAFRNKESALLEASYSALADGLFSRVEAAQFASAFLGKRIEPDTWRKRVDKYAHDNDLPPLKLTGGRPARKRGK